jgi:hypothetical protein
MSVNDSISQDGEGVKYSLPETDPIKRAELVAALRNLADIYEGNPTLPLVSGDLWIHQSSNDQLTREAAAGILRAFPGKNIKKELGPTMAFDIELTTGSIVAGLIRVTVAVNRDLVCRKIEKEIEVEEHIPTRFEQQDVPVEFETRLVTKTVSEWVCDEPLIGAAA